MTLTVYKWPDCSTGQWLCRDAFGCKQDCEGGLELSCDPECCCGAGDCCCDNLIYGDQGTVTICFTVTGDISGSGEVHNDGPEACTFEGYSDSGDWDFKGTGDCEPLDFESMTLECPGNGTEPGQYRLNIKTSGICDDVVNAVPRTGATCDPLSVIFDCTVTCEEVTCEFTIEFHECA